MVRGRGAERPSVDRLACKASPAARSPSKRSTWADRCTFCSQKSIKRNQPATGPKRRKRHGQPTVLDYLGTLDGEHQQQTGTTHAEAQSGTPDNGGTSDQRAEPQRNRLNAGLLRPTAERAADPAAAANKDFGSDRVDDLGDDGMGCKWGTGREDSEGRSGDRGCSDSTKRGDSSDGSGGGSGSSGGGDCGGSDSGGSDSGGGGSGGGSSN